MTALLVSLVLASSTSSLASAVGALAMGCTSFSCPSSGGNCDQQLGPSAENGENAVLGYDINAGTGNLFLSATDAKAQPALGPELVFSRYYNSEGWQSGAGYGNGDVGLGYGWTFSYSWQASMVGTNTVRIVTSMGRSIYFTSANGNGQAPWTPPAGEFGNLTGGPSTGFTYTTKFGTAFAFDTTGNSGRLLSITPADNTAVTVAYSAGTQISSVTSGGLSLTFAWTNGHISSITDPNGQTWSYAYDASWNLVNVTSPLMIGGVAVGTAYLYTTYTITDGTMQWTFSNSGYPHNLTGIEQNWNGASTYQYAANFNYDSAAVITAASGEINQSLLREVDLSYTFCSDTASTANAALNGGTKTITTNPVAGLQRITEISATGGSGAVGSEWSTVQYQWNPDATLYVVTDGNWNYAVYDNYDALGNPQTVIEGYSSSVARTTNYTYHPVLSRPLTISRTSVDGTHTHTKTFDYDSDYNTNYNQAPTNFLHQIVETGQTDTTMSGALGSTVTETTQFYYDSSSRIMEVTRPAYGGSSAMTLFTYWPATAGANEANRLEQVQQETTATTYLTSTYDTYDGDGRLMYMTDPNGMYHQAYYDAVGHPMVTYDQDPTQSSG